MVAYIIMATPRERMVASAAVLIRERGAQSTAIADVLAASGAPRGSAYHYFPGGRTQLLCEAVDFAADFVASKMTAATSSTDLLDDLVGFYREHLISTGHRAGCPVLAVTIEADANNPERTAPVIDRAAAAFTRWNDLITQRLTADGIGPERSEDLAVLMTAALEGAIVLARAARDVEPLDRVHRQLHDLLRSSR